MRIIYGSEAPASHDNEASQNSDRRAAPRVQTIMRVGRAISENDHGLARVRNISDDGVRLRLQIPVMLDDALTLELAEGVSLSGRVVWTDGDDCGLKFDRSIDCAALLADLAESAKQGTSRSLRLPVSISAVTRGENGIRLTQVSDISQRGMKLRNDGTFTEGLHVKVTLPSGLERRGVVRWSKDNFAGVMLTEPFSAEDLGSTRSLCDSIAKIEKESDY